MGRRRSDIDWKSVFLSYFSHDGAVHAQEDDDDDGAYFRITRPATKQVGGGFGPDVDVPASASKGLGPDVDVSTPASKCLGLDVDVPAPASKGLGPDLDVPAPAYKGLEPDVGVPARASKGLRPDVDVHAPKGVYDFSPVDEDEQGEHVSPEPEHCSKISSPSGQKKKNNGKLPMNKRKSQGHAGGKRKPYVNKRRDHAIDAEESDYERTLPIRISKRRKQQLKNSSSVHSRKVQDVVILDDEDVEPKEEVNCEMSDGLNEPKIYYPSRDDQEAVELTRSDIKCLNPRAFLSSPVINFYIKYIKRTRLCNESFRDKFYIFNTYFFGKLEEALHKPCNFLKLRRWWKGVNIFNNAYIILPIHMREHWSLVIVCLPPKDIISEAIILHLDSLGMHRSAKILNTVGRYLEMEWRFLSIQEPVWPFLLGDIRKETVQVPQQNNAYDCGIFMLYYIEQFIKEAPARFTPDTLDMFNRSWFKPEEASGLRQRIRELLLEEFERANKLDNAISKADAPESKGCDVIIKKDEELDADADNTLNMALEVDVELENKELDADADDTSNMALEVDVELGNKELDADADDTSNMALEVDVELGNEELDADADDTSKMALEVGVGMGNTVESNGGIKVATSQEASEVPINAVKVAASEESSEESPNAIKSIEVIKVVVVEFEEAGEVSGDSTESTKGINSVASESDEASGASGDTGKSKTNKDIKVTVSSEASVESAYPAKIMEDIADVAVLNKGPTSSSGNKCNQNNSGCVVSEAGSCSDSVNDIKTDTVKADSGSCSKAEKEGKSIAIASPQRLKGTDEEVIGSSTPTIQDAVSDSGVKRSEGNNNEEEATGSMPTPVAVCEITGTTMWITRIYRPEITLPLNNWCTCNRRSSMDDDARRAFIQQFTRKS